MDEARSSELRGVRGRARDAVASLEAQAAEVLRLAKRMEDLTGGTPGWYPGMRARVEAGETLRQVRVLARTLGHSDEDADRASGDPSEAG